MRKNSDTDSGVCQQCLFIRFFVLGALALLAVGLAAGENMQFLGMFTPTRVSAGIIVAGLFMSAFKYWLWRRELADNANEPG